jgi:hypothetical protein
MIGDIKHIVVFESLSNGERKTGKCLYDDCIKRHIDLFQKKMTHEFHDVSTKKEFDKHIKDYQINAENYKDGLLFHLEMHGDSNLNGLVLADGSSITWKELVDLFIPINIKTNNNLFLTMATCYGRHIFEGIDFSLAIQLFLKYLSIGNLIPFLEFLSAIRIPFSGYISASETITENEILDAFQLLFEKLIENGNIVNAYLELEQNGIDYNELDSNEQKVFSAYNELKDSKDTCLERRKMIYGELKLVKPDLDERRKAYEELEKKCLNDDLTSKEKDIVYEYLNFSNDKSKFYYKDLKTTIEMGFESVKR